MKNTTTEIHNRKASHSYHILSTVEAGVELTGTEVKSIRNGGGNLNEAYAQIKNNQAWVHHLHIAPYAQGNRENPEDPKRPRRLLLHKMEIRRLFNEVSLKGRSLIPLKGYFKKQWFKLLLGIATGKDKRDKRQDIIRRDTDRQIQRALRRAR